MRLFILISIWFALVLSEDIQDRESLLVQTNSGLVRGYKDPQEDVFVFFGIPYATAPTGTLRFKGPLPPPSWLNIFEAIDDRIICPQTRFLESLFESKVMQEDCLIANVYVPRTEKKDLPVLVYIHGGGFSYGFGNIVAPMKFVSSQNVIVVSFNYRLGAHGFLCLGTEDVPGNAGLKDQVALLRWVKKNIASFGGNPHHVTLAGYSAGSMSVELLMTSKMAEGLFHKVIPESGTCISAYCIQIDPLQNAKEYAKLIHIDGFDDILGLERKFKKVSYDVLQSEYFKNTKDLTHPFIPCIEKDNGQEIFLSDAPVNILKQGDFPKLPMLYGFTNMEGFGNIKCFESWQKELNENFENFLPGDLYFKSKEYKIQTANKIKEFYFGDKQIDYNTILQYIDYRSDAGFSCPTLRNVNRLLKVGHKEIFLYEYSYTDEYTEVVPHTSVRGATHCAQSDAVFDIFDAYSITKYYNNDSLNMKRIMRELWGNFIKNGKPTAAGTPDWIPIQLNETRHMALKKDPELRGPLLEERCRFWEEIYDSYYIFPISSSVSSRNHNEL